MKTMLNDLWSTPPTDLALAGDAVYVWRLVLDRPGVCRAQLEATLSHDERRHADELVFEQQRARFIVGRVLLRIILGRYLGQEPARLVLGYGAQGKPHLLEAGRPSALQFNITHSQNLALLAVARDREVGVDLEYVRPLSNLLQIAAEICSPHEQALLSRMPEAERQAAFFSCWTRKEAYVKACGMGLAQRLDLIDVTVGPDQPPRLLGLGDVPSAAAEWSLRALAADPECYAAVAAYGQDWTLRCWQWTG